MRLTITDSYPYLGVLAKGEKLSEVLEDERAIDQLRELVTKLTM